jgi:glutamyl-tRNA reductase
MTDCLPELEDSDRATAGDGGHDATDPAVDVAIDRIREHGEAVRDRQVERALSELDGLSAEEAAVIERLGDRLVDRLLAVPEEQLERAAGEGDDASFEAALSLFS